MYFISVKEKIRTVAKSWEIAYPSDSIFIQGTEKERIGKKLKLLITKDSTASDVEKIIGNNSWCEIICDECGESCKYAVQIGEEPDYESNTAFICLVCLENAISLLKKEINT